MSFFVYALCGVTSLACFVLLLRHYLQARSTLALRSSIAFLCFAIANTLLFLDLIVWPELNLSVFRNLTNLAGAIVLLIAVTSDRGRDLP
jgi:hypothetical protein